MALLLLLLAVLSPAQACAPRPGGNGTGKREVDEVHVTVVTNQKYNPSLNDEHLNTMRALLSDYAKSKGIVYNRDLVNEAVTKVNDRFAVVYTLLGADCDAVNNFAHGAKNQASFITHMEVKCGGKPEFVIV
ncbi:hypothetical protein Y032_0374g203 [Ancylostoma ceylanicum]|uniref:Cystatin domain-containing protein n=1 Tax=Ancylostoma ceylanicum TaxID=53326 RepID=A0A016RUH0_9BILA|nr:hypothetical protein Y032_0374g203 [Ancylostoma ceylanicum]